MLWTTSYLWTSGEPQTNLEWLKVITIYKHLNPLNYIYHWWETLPIDSLYMGVGNDMLKCVVTALIFCGCNLKPMIAFPFMGLPYCLTRDYDGRLGEIIYLNIASRMLSESHCPKRWLIGPQGIIGKLGRCWYAPPGLKSNWTSHDVPKLQSQPAGHCRAITQYYG